jgi:hypothetical protein
VVKRGESQLVKYYITYSINIESIMKTLALVIIYVLSFVCIFYILSLIGIIFLPYEKIVINDGWRIVYCMFFGWWLAILPTREIYIQRNWDMFG